MVVKTFDGYDADLFLFGSRAQGKTHKHSDYDIGYFTDSPPSPSRLSSLRESLEESSIPSRVEIVDFHHVPKRFRQIALSHVELWKQKTKNSLFTSKRPEKP